MIVVVFQQEASWSWSSPKQLPETVLKILTRYFTARSLGAQSSSLRESKLASPTAQLTTVQVLNQRSFRLHALQLLRCFQEATPFLLSSEPTRLGIDYLPSSKSEGPIFQVETTTDLFGAPVLTAVTFLSLLLARESRVLGNFLLGLF